MARAVVDTVFERQRTASQPRLDAWRQAFGTWALWSLIAIFVIWAAVAHTEQFVVGLIVGSLYALAAVGLTLIYGIARVPHFAHGDAMMLAAFLAFFVMTGTVAGSQTGDIAFPLQLNDLPGATDPIWRFSFGYGLIIAIAIGAALAVPILLAKIGRAHV